MPLAQPRPAMTFRVLIVCTGNICRSPIAERLLRSRLQETFGSRDDDVTVDSAGTGALVGWPIDPGSVAVLTGLGVPADDFAARALTPSMLSQADVVLTATTQHRDAAVGLEPRVMRRAFTLRELARLTADIEPDGLGEGVDLPTRWRALLAHASRRRGGLEPVPAGADDLEDPYRRGSEVFDRVGTQVVEAVDAVVSALQGTTATPDSPGRPAAPVPRPTPDPVPTSDPGSQPEPSPRPRTSPQPSGPGRGQAPRGGAAGGRRRSRRRRWPYVVGALVLLLAAGAWLLGTALAAKHHLVAARADVPRLRTAVLAGDTAAAQRDLRDLRRHADRAESLTHDPLWWVAGKVPWAGASPHAVATVASAAQRLADDVVGPLVDSQAAIGPATLRPKAGRVDLTPLTGVAPTLGSARTALTAVQHDLAAVPGSGPLPAPVLHSVSQLQAQLTDVGAVLDSADAAVQVLPPMLGADGPRRYLLAFQNNAEARGTGGLLGAYGIVVADHGRVTLEHLGSNRELTNRPDHPALDLGADFRSLYGDDPALWVNANLSPHFPYAAQLWARMWQDQTGQRLDGVVATDPVALGYVLGATGPVTLPDGRRLSGDAVAGFALDGIYRTFPLARQDPQRDLYLRSLAAAAFTTVTSGGGDSSALLKALARAGSERRLLVWSAHPEEQRRLVGHEVAGELPTGAGAFASLVVVNAAGNKLDYYLDRSLTYAAGRCPTGLADSQVTVTLHNRAPGSGLPEYVSIRSDRLVADRSGLALSASPPLGTDRSTVRLYASKGAALIGATLDGRAVSLSSGRELGHTVLGLDLELRPGQTRTLVIDLAEASATGRPSTVVQPLARPQATTLTTRLACSGF